VRSAAASARYVVKDLRDGSKKEVPPAEFGGRLFSYSKRFLAESLKALLRAAVTEWQTQARKKAAHQGDTGEPPGTGEIKTNEGGTGAPQEARPGPAPER
jgi:hypothetical protein